MVSDSVRNCPMKKIANRRSAAFILYRQHHQSQVTADNPKLSNPEISKIIGDKWKHEQEDVKENWKKLAEEEKQRHQHQYPNYRYQPRRGTKGQGSFSATSPTEEQGRCSKCNGRFIATPRTPSTPAASPAAKGGAGPAARGSLDRIDTSLPRPMHLDISPKSKLPYPSQFPPVRTPEENVTSSPEMKRRRANESGSYHPVNGFFHGSFSGGQSRDHNRVASDGGQHGAAIKPFAPLPELGSITRSQSGPMPPPPRPGSLGSWGSDGNIHTHRRNSFVESLRLPPLQTSVPASPSGPPGLDPLHAGTPPATFGSMSSPQEPSERSLDSPTMPFTFRRKLGVLGRFCRPAPPMARTGIPHQTRGAFIAVEGSNASMMKEVGQAIERGLLACDDFGVKAWSGQTSSQESGKASEDLYPNYFETVLSWREKSKEISHHITASGNKADNEYAQEKLPVALVKDGFSLTASDNFASEIPPGDLFGTVDHWQWVASLWRGTISPDLVVYVKPSEEDEINSLGTVEFSRAMGLIVVRIPSGKSLDEATERRVAFELMEWMREGSYKEEVPKNWRQNSI